MNIPTSVNYIVSACSYIGEEPEIFSSKINHYTLDGGRYPFLPHAMPAIASDYYPFHIERDRNPGTAIENTRVEALVAFRPSD